MSSASASESASASASKALLRFAGVPEAFNDPFFLTSFPEHANSIFISHPGGSGSMIRALQCHDVDAAFLLTECALATIANGSPFKILSPLVTSPLIWAVIVSPNSNYQSLSDLFSNSTTWGISRMGSGSHVMACIAAAAAAANNNNKVQQQPLKFKVCTNLNGLTSALKQNEIDVFLWEWYTSSPLKDEGEVKFIDQVPTPWGCFCVTVHVQNERIDDIRCATNAFLKTANDTFKTDIETPKHIAAKHGMKEVDARAWLSKVQYADENTMGLEESEEKRIEQALKLAHVI